MSQFKKPTKKEIQRCADIIVHYFNNDKVRERENELYIALESRLHRRALVEVALAKAFDLDPF